MFANFIYFIIALLILSLYEPTDELPFSLPHALLLFVGLSVLFAAYTRAQFQLLLRSVDKESRTRLDHRFGLLVTRHSIYSLVLLAIDIWGLHLPAYLNSIQWLSLVPTLSALLFLLLFVGYLTIVWAFSFDAHRHIYHTDISRSTYVYSNAAFSVPILIPWTLLFGITDIIRLLPFEWPKQILDSTAGQTGYFLVFLLVAALFAPILIKRFWRCHPLEAGLQRSRIEALCSRAGVGYADIVYWPIFGGRMITAGVMGLVSRFRYILVTDALMQILTADEIDQVIAHEIGHVKRKHLLLYLLFFIGFMLISYSVSPISYYLLFFTQPILNFVHFLDIDLAKTYYIVSSVLLVAMSVIYFRYMFGYFMRNFERQADIFIFRLFPTAQPLVSTFDKIVASSGQPADKPNWHHFSIQQRVDFLRRCEFSPAWITHHDRKVHHSILAFVIGLVMLFMAAFQFNQMVISKGHRNLNVDAIEAHLDQKETKTNEDGILYWVVGNVHYDKQNIERAAAAYEKALALTPDNADVLNNLAWLLATSDNSKLYKPQRALYLAQKAIELKKEAHIWDTLAQSLFINGRVQEAIDAEQQALAMNPENRKIYEEQLEKFKRTLGQ